MTPVTLVIVSCLLQCVISSIAIMFCPPKIGENNSSCMSTNLANLSNSIICVVVILILLKVIPMPGGQSDVTTV